MEGLFGWVEGSAVYAVFRALNRGLWRFWDGSTVARALQQSLRELWRRSAVARVAEAFAAWMRHSFVGSLLTVSVVSQPSVLARRLRREIGAEQELFRATRVEKFLLYFVVFFVPVEIWLITFLPLTTKYLGDLALILLLLGSLFRLQQAGWPLRRTPADLPVAILLATGILSTVWNSVPMHIAVFGLRAYLEYFALYLVVAYLPWPDHERRALLLWFLALGVAIALFGDAQTILHVATPRAWLSTLEAATTRAFGTMGNPNTFGAFLVWLLSLLMALLVVPVRGGIRLLALLGMAIALPALFFTLSREALVAAAVTALFVAVAADRRLLVPLILGALAVPILDPHIVSRFAIALNGNYIRVSSSYGRLLFWERGIQAFLAKPLLGWGPGRFGGSVAHLFGSPVYYLLRLGEKPIIDSQHVQTLAELGVLGYIAYLWLGLAAVRTGLKLFREDDDPFWRAIGLALAAGTVGLYVQSFFASLLETHPVILVFWLIFGMAVYRLRMRARATPQASQDEAQHGRKDRDGATVV